MSALRDVERPLVAYLFALASIPVELDALQVEPMADGGMGSLSIAPVGDRQYGCSAAECHFHDADGVVVSATLNLDRSGLPFEIDVWKVDATPTFAWPVHQQIHAGPPGGSSTKNPP